MTRAKLYFSGRTLDYMLCGGDVGKRNGWLSLKTVLGIKRMNCRRPSMYGQQG